MEVCVRSTICMQQVIEYEQKSERQREKDGSEAMLKVAARNYRIRKPTTAQPTAQRNNNNTKSNNTRTAHTHIHTSTFTYYYFTFGNCTKWLNKW